MEIAVAPVTETPVELTPAQLRKLLLKLRWIGVDPDSEVLKSVLRQPPEIRSLFLTGPIDSL
jgi:hypothetical protein